MGDATLFGRAAQEDLRAATKTFETKERVVFDKFITLDGTRFDAVDLLTTLLAVESRNVRVTHRKMADALVKLRVLRHGGGSSYSAETGENYALLVELLEELMPDE